MDQLDTAKSQKARSGERSRLVLGLGCDRGTPLTTLLEAIDQALGSLDADWSAVAAMASIDLKADEVAMRQLMQDKNLPIRFFAAAQLAEVAVPNPSEVVRKYTGTPSVSEAAALLMAGQLERGGVWATKPAGVERLADDPASLRARLANGASFVAEQEEGVSGMSRALPSGEVEGPGSRSGKPLYPSAPISALLIEKHKLRGPDGRNATVSVARVPGGVNMSSIGPGQYRPLSSGHEGSC
ncbi:MAG: cobalamin biosynthesis protein [Lautropia sp.]|nr:cobalamin biosynthesis protein [Lautropia sp.]